MIDSHCHLADEAFAADLDAVVLRAQQAGVSRALCILAMDEPDEAARSARVAALWPAVRFAVGIHPHQAGRFTQPLDESTSAVRRAIEAVPGARAIGEIGLDFHYDLAPRSIQRDLFGAQLGLACEMQLPVVVHTREAEAETIAIVEELGAGVSGVLHCFTGSADLAHWAIERGWCVSFAGIITFQNAARLRRVAEAVPLDRLLIETDCPYLAPVPHRGTRNEPSLVVNVARQLAAVKQVTLEHLSEAVTRNFQRVFGP